MLRSHLVGAAGVVLVNLPIILIDQHHPVCRSKVASRHYIDAAATPPRLRRGVTRLAVWHIWAAKYVNALAKGESRGKRQGAICRHFEATTDRRDKTRDRNTSKTRSPLPL